MPPASAWCRAGATRQTAAPARERVHDLTAFPFAELGDTTAGQEHSDAVSKGRVGGGTKAEEVTRTAVRGGRTGIARRNSLDLGAFPAALRERYETHGTTASWSCGDGRRHPSGCRSRTDAGGAALSRSVSRIQWPALLSDRAPRARGDVVLQLCETRAAARGSSETGSCARTASPAADAAGVFRGVVGHRRHTHPGALS